MPTDIVSLSFSSSTIDDLLNYHFLLVEEPCPYMMSDKVDGLDFSIVCSNVSFSDLLIPQMHMTITLFDLQQNPAMGPGMESCSFDVNTLTFQIIIVSFLDVSQLNNFKMYILVFCS